MYVRSIPQSFIFPLFVLSFNFLMAICKLRTLFKSQFGISLASNRWNVVTSQWLKSCSSGNAKYSLAKSLPVCCVETEQRQYEADFACNLGSKRYYIQSAYRMFGVQTMY